MKNAAVEAASEPAGKIVDPLRVDAVGTQCRVLPLDLLALFRVGGETEAAGPAKRVACEIFHSVECALGPAPEVARLLDAVRLACDVIRGGAAAEREAAVAAACSFRDTALVVHAHAEARLGQPEGGRAAGDARTDDRDVDAAGVLHLPARRRLLFEPVRVHVLELKRKD